MLQNIILSPHERWKDILTYEGQYRVSDHGRILIISRNRITTGRDNSKGYLQIDLRKEGESRSFLVHRLVALHFVGIPKVGHEANHKDGDKKNNNFQNLEWLSHLANVTHACELGLAGRKAPKRKNAKSVINEKTGEIYGSVGDLAKIIGCSRKLLSMKLNGKRKNSSPFRFASNQLKLPPCL